jgi:hypothetical protein
MKKPKKPKKPLYDIQGRRIIYIPGKDPLHLPLGVELFQPPPRFVSGVLCEVSEQFRITTAIPSLNIVFDKNGVGHKLGVLRRSNILWWKILDDSSHIPVAAGYLRIGRDRKGAYIRESRAAAKSHVRGKGLYAAVLREIRREEKTPLISDRVLSLPNLLTWLKVAVPDDDRRGYAINPPHRRLTYDVALSHAQAWINVG